MFFQSESSIMQVFHHFIPNNDFGIHMNFDLNLIRKKHINLGNVKTVNSNSDSSSTEVLKVSRMTVIIAGLQDDWP